VGEGILDRFKRPRDSFARGTPSVHELMANSIDYSKYVKFGIKSPTNNMLSDFSIDRMFFYY
jgi:hypothetical protein